MKLASSMVWRFLFLAFLPVGCSTSDSLVLATDGVRDLVVLFALQGDEAGGVVAASAPIFSTDAGRAENPVFRAAIDRDAWLIGYTKDDLVRATPLYDHSRFREVSLETSASPGCPRGRLESRASKFDRSAPTPSVLWQVGEAGLIESAPDDARFLESGQLFMTLPVDPEACLEPGLRELAPYADRAVPIPIGTMLGSAPLDLAGSLFTRVHRLPDDRILLMSRGWLLLLDPGQPFVPEPGRFLSTQGGSSGFATDADWVTPGAPFRVVIVTFFQTADVPGAWQEIEVGPNGLSLVETLVVPERVQDVVFNPSNGWFVGAGDQGSIVVRRDRSSPLEWKPDRFAFDEPQAVMTLTGWAEAPYALTGIARGSVLQGSPDLERWDALPSDGLDPSLRLRAIGARPGPDGSRLYVSNNNAELLWLHRAAGQWRRHELRLSPTYACGGADGCGFNAQVLTLRDLRFVTRGGESRLYATMNDCMTVLDARLDVDCAGYLPMPGRSDLRPSTGELGGDPFLLNVRAIDVSPSGWLTVASQEGGVYEMFVGDSDEGRR